ncbi:MAG: zinc-dependent metalloprotease [Propionibacteriaceae bacterium]|nr:zinc-dependent metalloprotease [Propionibacteriaceae bacterium]
MNPFDPSNFDDDPMEALSRFFKDLGMPDMGDLNDSARREDLLRAMMKKIVPSHGKNSETIVWETVRQMARQYVSSLGPDPTGSSRAQRMIAESVRLGELWMSEATTFTPVSGGVHAWSRAEWIEATLPAWKSMLEPVIETLAQAITSATGSPHDMGDDMMASLQFALQPLLSSVISATFGAHVGEGLGKAAISTVSGTDMGLPLLGDSSICLLTTNLNALYQQDDIDEDSVVLYCSIREVARQRLFHEVAWISPQIITLVQHFAREMTVDPDAMATTLEDALPEHLTSETLVSFQADFTSLLFHPERSEEQRQILGRLTTLLGLVEGWVEDVTTTVAEQWFPGWEPIAESLRRHRAASDGSSSGVTPILRLAASAKEVREASNFWRLIREKQGIEARDEIWRYPESMPTSAEISDVDSFLNRPSPSEDPWDDELRKFLQEG